jgi:phospholipid/cholesterol/gamma-HCH transport system permease protein
MTHQSASRSRLFPRIRRVVQGWVNGLTRIGLQAEFYGRTVVSVGTAVRMYKRETVRLIAGMSMGTGSLAVLGGTTVIVGFLTLSTGALIAVQGYNQFSNVGVEALTGFASACFNVWLIAPVIAGVGLAATIGAGGLPLNWGRCASTRKSMRWR